VNSETADVQATARPWVVLSSVFSKKRKRKEGEFGRIYIFKKKEKDS